MKDTPQIFPIRGDNTGARARVGVLGLDGSRRAEARRKLGRLIEELESQREGTHQQVLETETEMRTLAALQRLVGFYDQDETKHHPKWGSYVMSPLRHYQMNSDRLRELSPGLIEELEAAHKSGEPFLVSIEDYGFTQEVVLAMLNIAQIARITLILIPKPVAENDTSTLPSSSHLQFSLQDAEGNAKPGSMLKRYRRKKPPDDFPADIDS